MPKELGGRPPGTEAVAVSRGDCFGFGGFGANMSNPVNFSDLSREFDFSLKIVLVKFLPGSDFTRTQ